MLELYLICAVITMAGLTFVETEYYEEYSRLDNLAVDVVVIVFYGLFWPLLLTLILYSYIKERQTGFVDK